MTARTVRDKFARLSQMATLLTLESVRGDKPGRVCLPLLGSAPCQCWVRAAKIGGLSARLLPSCAPPRHTTGPCPANICRPFPASGSHPLLPPWCSLLRCLQVGEVLDYWGDAGAIAWRLTDNDVRQTLSQRVDFAPNEILSLKL